MENIQSCFKRYEKKYCLTLAQQQAILQEMQPYMKKDAYGQYTICNLYYDTDDWRLIRTSLEKPLYKEKLRVRSYGTPAPDGNVFVEIKKKYDGVVYKRRITDLDLRCGDYGVPLGGYGDVLMEIKIPGTAPLWLAHLLSETGVFSTSFSKYGSCYSRHILGAAQAEHKEVFTCA